MTHSQSFYGRDEAVAAAGQRLDVSGRLGAISEGRPQFFDAVVDPLLVVDERPGSPYGVLDVLTRHQFSGASEQTRQ